MIDILIEPLHYPFMVRGLLAALMVGIVCGIVGTFVVLRGMAFFGDALAHAVLPGVAAGYLLAGAARGVLFWWALGTAVLVSIGIGAVRRAAQIKEDTAIGIIFVGMFALGIAMISATRNYAVDLIHFLFGDVLGVSWSDLTLIFVFGGLVCGLIFFLYKEFVILSFDDTLARTLRLPTRRLYYTLLILIAATVVVSMQTVGVALMLAMLITPPASAYLLARRLPAMIAWSAAIGAASGLIGLYLSFHIGIASGAAIVLVCTAFFILVVVFKQVRQIGAR